MVVMEVGPGPSMRLSIWPERMDAHAGPYRVQAWGANYRLRKQTAFVGPEKFHLHTHTSSSPINLLLFVHFQ